jgi:hypothetical protein
MDYRDFVDAGLPVFALWPIEGGVCGCGRPDCEAAGKHPEHPTGSTPRFGVMSNWIPWKPWASLLPVTACW